MIINKFYHTGYRHGLNDMRRIKNLIPNTINIPLNGLQLDVLDELRRADMYFLAAEAERRWKAGETTYIDDRVKTPPGLRRQFKEANAWSIRRRDQYLAALNLEKLKSAFLSLKNRADAGTLRDTNVQPVYRFFSNNLVLWEQWLGDKYAMDALKTYLSELVSELAHPTAESRANIQQSLAGCLRIIESKLATNPLAK